jgi:uncharacterized membrane protein
MPDRPREAGLLARRLEAVRIATLSPAGIGVVTALFLVAADIRRRAGVEPPYGYLVWNLFLAWIPLVLAYAVSWAACGKITRLALPVLAIAWIVFLPNAPYLVTDLVHLYELFNVPNLIVLALLAITGLLIGVKSVQLVQLAVEGLWGETAGWRAVQFIAVLTAFGVYLGRELRWNSWTILDRQELAHAFIRSPSQPGRVALDLLGIVVFAGAFYLSYRVLTGARAEQSRLAR